MENMLKVPTWRTFDRVWLFFNDWAVSCVSEALSKEGIGLPDEEQKGNR